ncbi:MAG: ATP-binding protein [Rubrivivax sp.]|nr:ATP-binding protein [Rubrivivax sp.]
MTRPAHSLQGHLLAWVLGVVASVWIATAALTWVDVSDELDELLDGHLAQAAALLVVQQAGEVEDDDRTLDAPTLHKYAPQVAFQVFHDGRLALRSANAPALPMVEQSKRFKSGFKTVRIEGTDWRVFAARGAERDVQVYVGEQLKSRAAILWAVLRSTLWPMAVALPLLALVGWWAIRRGLLPLRRLGGVLAARQAQSLQPVVLKDSPSELNPMVDALNGLLQRIGTLVEGERRFTADAAHELRTPIAAIRAQAQVALSEADAAQRHHALQAALDGCDRATRLVEQLLTLSRLEAQATPSSRTVDLAAVVRQAVADVAPRAVGKGQTLELDATERCPVAADEILLAVLVRNLVDNAVRYSPPGARVSVSVQRQGDRVALRVEDSGPGLAPAVQGRLGQRFFRPPGQDESGSGLGWSIVRRIAEVQRLDIDIGPSAMLGGLAVQVSAPAAAEPPDAASSL